MIYFLLFYLSGIVGFIPIVYSEYRRGADFDIQALIAVIGLSLLGLLVPIYIYLDMLNNDYEYLNKTLIKGKKQ